MMWSWDWPKNSRDKERHFSTVEELMNLCNLVPFQNILSGEPIMKPASNSADAAGIAPLVDKNMRAFPVKIPRWVAKSKMLYPGAYGRNGHGQAEEGWVYFWDDHSTSKGPFGGWGRRRRRLPEAQERG